jgi:hypothetical protein
MKEFRSVTSLPAIAGTPPEEMFTGMKCGIPAKVRGAGLFRNRRAFAGCAVA